MKKFMKVCAITVAVIFCLGIVLLTAGGCGGGLKSIPGMIMRGEFNFGPDDFADWGWDKDWNWDGDWDWNQEYDLDMESMFDNEFEVIKDEDSYSQTFGFEEIHNLKLELGGCEVKVAVSPDENYHVSAEMINSFQTYVKGDTLYVKGVKNGNWTNNSVMSVEILIPEGAVFENAELSLGAGDFAVSALKAKRVEAEVGAGRLEIEYLQTTEMECQLGAGQVIVKEGEILGNASFETGAGELIYNGIIFGDLKAECAMGNTEFHITGSAEEDHNYDLECMAGNLTAGSNSYAGLAVDKYIDNGAASEYDLSCAMGNLTVTFQ